jgi:hypothetical protein
MAGNLHMVYRIGTVGKHDTQVWLVHGMVYGIGHWVYLSTAQFPVAFTWVVDLLRHPSRLMLFDDHISFGLYKSTKIITPKSVKTLKPSDTDLKKLPMGCDRLAARSSLVPTRGCFFGVYNLNSASF